jgi:2,4-dienoyl-CoA reductase-like NADH-dependent reductase (Old Yellow Enzyme family)
MSAVLSPDRATDPLLQPFRLRHLMLRNRIMGTSYACDLKEGGMPKDCYQRYQES